MTAVLDTIKLCGRLDESRGYNMHTCSGLPVWPKDPKAADIRPTDIAGALSRLCRYNGHIKNWQFIGPFSIFPRRIQIFSVAQHSCFVEKKVAERIEQAHPYWKPENKRLLRLAALLHDAPEYVLGDMIKPQKNMYAERDAYEDSWDDAVAERFSFPVELVKHPFVKEADYRSFLTEQRDLLRRGSVDFGTAEAEPYPEKIIPVLPSAAYRMFIKRFNQLYRGE